MGRNERGRQEGPGRKKGRREQGREKSKWREEVVDLEGPGVIMGVLVMVEVVETAVRWGMDLSQTRDSNVKLIKEV